MQINNTLETPGTPVSVLDCELSTDNDNSIEIDLDCEIASLEPLTPQSIKSYCGKLRMLSNIHKEIAPILNQKRQTYLDAFFSQEDRFIPEDGSSLLTLWFDTMKADSMPQSE